MRIIISIFLFLPFVCKAQILQVPPLQEAPPTAGKRVKIVPQGLKTTNTYYSLYLPENWQSDKKYPVIVEYTGNKFAPSASTGKVQDACLGYAPAKAISAIWVVLPFIANDNSETFLWWGNEQKTIDFALKNIRNICEQYGGNSGEIFLCGFSRGAIGVNYIGLYNDEIADVWRGFFTHDHYDGAHAWNTSWAAFGNLDEYRKQAHVRAQRINGRAALVSNESAANNDYVIMTSIDTCGEFTIMQPDISSAIEGMNVPHNHTDRWMLSQKDDAQKVFAWFQSVLDNKYGVFSISGNVKDAKGKPIKGAIVEAGGVHFAISDSCGNYKITGLQRSHRTIRLANGYSNQTQNIELSSDVIELNFIK